jgi:GTP-binding protein HflX
VTGEGIETLLAAIEAHVSGELTSFAVKLQPSQLRLADWIYRNSEVVSRKDEEDGSVALSLTMTESAREELEGRLRGRA